MIKTVIGSFDSADDADRATRDLRNAGFLDSDINLIVNNAQEVGAGIGSIGVDTGPMAKGAVAGGILGGAAGLAASLAGLAVPGIGPILAAGPIVATLAGAGAGAVAGGLIGSLTELGVDKNDAELYAESVRRGGSLVAVRSDESRVDEVAAILRKAGAIDISKRAEDWRSTGWSGYDPSAKPYTGDEIERDRSRYRAEVEQPLAGAEMGVSDGAWAASRPRMGR